MQHVYRCNYSATVQMVGSIGADRRRPIRLVMLAAILATVLTVTVTSKTRAGGGSTPAPPLIIDFVAVNESGMFWSFQGTVSDPNPTSCTVYLGGIPALQGVSVPVEADGSFFYSCELTHADDGTATAQAVDKYSQRSNIADANVTP